MNTYAAAFVRLLTPAVMERHALPLCSNVNAAADTGGLGETRPTLMQQRERGCRRRRSRRDTPYHGGAFGAPKFGKVSATD
ncbi:MAG: hypothetical protein GX230_07025 [Lentisphaerae bacterium]|nr:hypothetical protein [Lentisphaerota bacterium]